MPLGSVPGWWDERTRYKKAFVTTFEWKPNGIMRKGAHKSLKFATNVFGTLLKAKSTLSWVALLG
eukprot:372100-Pelagomonas_calceolata.AAC.1